MNTVVQTLRDKAAELRLTPESVAVQMLKEAGLPEEDARFEVAQNLMEKEALSTLTDKGIDMEEAVKLVKAANINVRELANFSFDTTPDPLAEILEKTAAYIEKLEAQIQIVEGDNTRLCDDLEKLASEMPAPVAPTLPGSLGKMAAIGAFTNEDLVELQRFDPQLLTKVASAMDEPWGFGAPAGVAHAQTDPLLEFILA